MSFDYNAMGLSLRDILLKDVKKNSRCLVLIDETFFHEFMFDRCDGDTLEERIGVNGRLEVYKMPKVSGDPIRVEVFNSLGGYVNIWEDVTPTINHEDYDHIVSIYSEDSSKWTSPETSVVYKKTHSFIFLNGTGDVLKEVTYIKVDDLLYRNY